MTHEFKHPKYYTELRKRNKSDQAISNPRATAGDGSVRPDPGHKLQAASYKPQASSTKLNKKEATSLKPQAASLKLQASSYKLHDSWTTEKFHGTRTEGLDHDKRVVWMLHMKANLVWWKSYFIPLTDL